MGGEGFEPPQKNPGKSEDFARRIADYIALADPGVSDPPEPSIPVVVEELLRRWRLLEPARRIEVLTHLLEGRVPRPGA